MYHTTVMVRTLADWARLEELGVVVLGRTAQGITTDAQENTDQVGNQSASSWKSAVILPDDAQLEALARLHFEP